MSKGDSPRHSRTEELLGTLETVEEEMAALAGDVEDLLETPLDDEDLIDLLWAKKHDRTKGGTREAVDALASINQKDQREVMTRLVAGYGNMTLDEAEEFIEDLYRIRERYGQLFDRTPADAAAGGDDDG